MNLSDPGALFESALRSHQTGDLSRAAEGYEAALRINGDFAPALHYLGLIVYQRGDAPRAVALIEKALTLAPSLGEARYNLGNIFRELGRPDDAERCYRGVLAGEPDNPEALHNLLMLRKERGDLLEAETLARRLVGAAPRYAAGHATLAAILFAKDRREEAFGHLRKAAELEPDSVDHLCNLGRALIAAARPGEAEVHLRQALRLNPADTEVQTALGRALTAQGRDADAIEVFGELVRRSPDDLGHRGWLAAALNAGGRPAEAAGVCREILAREPRHVIALAELANISFNQGRGAEAVGLLRRALEVEPENVVVRSNLLFFLCFCEDADPREVYAEHRRFDEIHAQPLSRDVVPFENDRSPDRRLRIGYLSPDFRFHPGGHFLAPPFANHDRARFEIFAYSANRQRDEFTDFFRSAADHWRDVTILSDAALASTIRQDRIDILVECAGHMAENRLLAVARRPAPIQISFPLYPNTTGLSAVQYRIADPYFGPPSADDLHSEILLRLPDTHVCYEPIDRIIQPGPPPSLKSGVVTFGSFNNAAKLGDRTIRLWAEVLKKAPNYRLLLKWLRADGNAPWIVERFVARGIPADRVQIVGPSPSAYRPYLDVDICLDPLHANGGTTTCDALWMGVPVVTRPGDTPFSRVGLCHLTNVGLPELIAADDEAYIRIAAGLANSPERLMAVRTGLRERFARSPLMDGARYTRHLETAFRQVWTDWCRSPPGSEGAAPSPLAGRR